MTVNETMEAMLAEASATVAKRGDSYGTPIDDFKRIAKMWNVLGENPQNPEFEPQDVAMFMICLKLSRLTHSPDHYDNWLDIAGYAACGWACVKDATMEEVKEVLGTFVGEASSIYKPGPHDHTINTNVYDDHHVNEVLR